MTRVGLYLGIGTSAGGMFQYAQSVLEALVSCSDIVDPVVAYVDEIWSPIVEATSSRAMRLRAGRLGARMADAAMTALLPASIAQGVARSINPVARQLAAADCDMWIFAAQESLGYQIGQPIIVAVHDLMHRYEAHFPEVAGNGRLRIRDHRFSNLVRSACTVLVDSEVGRQHVLDCYGSDPDKICPLPYVPPSYITNASEPADFEQRYSLPSKFLFYPAQFWAHKNHIALLDALALVRQRGHNVELVCTGGHRYNFPKVTARAARLGLTEEVHFPGYVPESDMIGFYRRARALIMPTHFGPTNIPPLEAFACGCPVAVSDIYAMPEQVGDSALLFDHRSAPSIADAITRLWCDDALCERLRAGGLERSMAWRQPQFNARFRPILETALERSRMALRQQT